MVHAALFETYLRIDMQAYSRYIRTSETRRNYSQLKSLDLQSNDIFRMRPSKYALIFSNTANPICFFPHEKNFYHLNVSDQHHKLVKKAGKKYASALEVFN
jgi:hypothetical protein